jgi:hypothetical protein
MFEMRKALAPIMADPGGGLEVAASSGSDDYQTVLEESPGGDVQ